MRLQTLPSMIYTVDYSMVRPVQYAQPTFACCADTTTCKSRMCILYIHTYMVYSHWRPNVNFWNFDHKYFLVVMSCQFLKYVAWWCMPTVLPRRRTIMYSTVYNIIHDMMYVEEVYKYRTTPSSFIWRSITYTSTLPSNFALWLKLDCQLTVNFFQPSCPFST